MADVKLSNIVTVLEGLDYPLTREAAVEDCADVTLVLAEGTVALDDVIADSSEAVFDSMNDLLTEVMLVLPRKAVGEAGQSEGDA